MVSSLAGVGAAVLSALSLIAVVRFSRRTLRQGYSIAGAQLAVDWRNQILELRREGLTVSEIRELIHTEAGWTVEAEAEAGSIDEIVRIFDASLSRNAQSQAAS